MLNFGFLLWLSASTLVFICAGVVLRTYVDSGATMTVIGALFLYCLGNLMMVRLMREGGLGVAISLSAIMQLLMANVVAYAWFDERPNQLQFVGILLGIVAIGFILWPVSDGA